MNLNLTKEEFVELLQVVYLGTYVRNAVREQEGEYDHARDEALGNRLYRIALELGVPGIEQDEKYKYVGPSNALEKEWHDIIEAYEEDEFWHELEVLLGKRDFYRTMTREDSETLEKTGWLPERIHDLYEKYADEFEKFGIERLEINKNAPISDVRDLL
ncbi:hypothetical protein KGM48_01855 [Patescibacteria group bacterium]|nr:hypothetical protein [Patescibacteria group bacterium]